MDAGWRDLEVPLHVGFRGRLAEASNRGRRLRSAKRLSTHHPRADGRRATCGRARWSRDLEMENEHAAAAPARPTLDPRGGQTYSLSEPRRRSRRLSPKAAAQKRSSSRSVPRAGRPSSERAALRSFPYIFDAAITVRNLQWSPMDFLRLLKRRLGPYRILPTTLTIC